MNWIEKTERTINTMHRAFAFGLATLFIAGCATEMPNSPDVAIIPNPVSVTAGSGMFVLNEDTAIQSTASLTRVSERFAYELRRSTGLPLPVSVESGNITVSLRDDLGAEAYSLSIKKDQITIVGGDEAGVFYAFQSLRQLFPAQIEAAGLAMGVSWEVPVLEIRDAPRFSYRGLHLDVGRHFFDVDFVKKYIDTMSRYKFNQFHWHLTEDQGWRIEIPKYPRLTEVAAWRKETMVDKNFDPYVGDGIPHGGFYTQDEIREVVAYAAERFVNVIPEIEMPGHSSAVVAAYPQFGCTNSVVEVPTTWGIKDEILCPSEETFTFLEDVLTDVVALFPGKYIHIGADEVPKTKWENSALAQKIIQREGLDGEHGLQSWFIRRIETFLNANNKSLIGWDEILEGGLAPNATVMSWRGTEGGIAAAKQGHDVIMTPTKYMYFDFYQADPSSEPLAMNWAGYSIPIDTVYSFEPIPKALSATESTHILGAQANVWTEYISTPEYVEYMVYPRALALSEVVWTPVDRKSREGFYKRMMGNLAHLEMMGVNYRIPEGLDASSTGMVASN